MERQVAVVGLLLLLVSSITARVSYEGHSVVRMVPETMEQLIDLADLTESANLDVWMWAEEPGLPVDIRVSPEESDVIMAAFSRRGLSTRTIIPNIQSLITAPRDQRPDGRNLDTSVYYTLQEMWDYLDEKAEECDSCDIDVIGSSWEGRDLKVFKMMPPGGGSDAPALWIDCGIHAREWISPAICQYVIERLTSDYGSDPEVTEIRDYFEWYIDPVVNPDGYNYTHYDDRMWRKTRSDYGESCLGTDGNRNFVVGWGGLGSSSNVCSQSYKGPAAFSESETRSLDEYVFPMKDKFRLVFTIHSYGQFMVWPWGFTTEVDVEDQDDLDYIGGVLIDAANAVHDTGYYHRRSNGDMAGNTIDWGKGQIEAKYAYLLEVRDDGEYGFLLPEEQIIEVDEEIYAGIKAMALEMKLELEG